MEVDPRVGFGRNQAVGVRPLHTGSETMNRTRGFVEQSPDSVDTRRACYELTSAPKVKLCLVFPRHLLHEFVSDRVWRAHVIVKPLYRNPLGCILEGGKSPYNTVCSVGDDLCPNKIGLA